jgi:hypothetical protein
MMDLITIAMGLAQFVPQLTKWISGSDKAEEVAQKAVDIAKAVTGRSTGDDALTDLRANPDLVLAFRKAVLDQSVEFERLAVANAKDVNETMRAEAAAEHWPSYSWRPSIGFAVAADITLCGLTVFAAYVVAMITGKAEHLQYIPGMLAAMAGIIGVAMPVLGIASWFRGKMQADPSIPTINRG